MSAGDLFLSRLPPDARNRFYGHGIQLEIAEGEYLLRRGEPGGDLFVVTEGSLEVVDTRYRPEVVLDTIGAGDIVGDMAFLDQGPRSADVRAIGPVVCLKFVRADLLNVFKADAEVAAEFYRALCERMSDRHRELATVAVVGGIGRRRTLSAAMVPWIGQQSAEIAGRARAAFTHGQTQLRRSAEPMPVGEDDPTQEAERQGSATVSRGLRELVEESSAYVARFAEVQQAVEAGKWIADDLWAWLARSRLGRRALGRPPGPNGLAQVRAAMLSRDPIGDDTFGVELERALFDLPTVQAVKAVRAATLEGASSLLAHKATARVALLSPNPGTWLDEWRGPELECVAFGGGEPQRDGLGHGTLLRLEADLLRLSAGRSRVSLPPFDLVVVDGLLEHLSERWSTLVLGFCRGILQPWGSLVAATLPATPDEPFFRAVLDIPTVRRSTEDLVLILVHAGFEPRPITPPPLTVGGPSRPLLRAVPGLVASVGGNP